uniref:WW domain-containing protein n=1 Tax=Globisporangium ultimum (strain ATCC 200006 / CBS 805.95 / DAOM BR144) TaxID=431595 RepID=K3WZ79_GLOUD
MEGQEQAAAADGGEGVLPPAPAAAAASKSEDAGQVHAENEVDAGLQAVKSAREKRWDDAADADHYNVQTREVSWELPDEARGAIVAIAGRGEEQQAVGDTSEQDAEREETPEQLTASVEKIQCVFRGHSTRSKLKRQQQWIRQFDPVSQQNYFYNIVTGESQWEQPADYVRRVHDAKIMGIVKIESLFRSKRVRGHQARGLKVRDTRDIVNQECGNREDVNAAVAKEPDVATIPDPHGNRQAADCEANAVLSIQCAFRKHAAIKAAESKRGDLRDTTSSDVINQKIGDLMRAMDEIQTEISARHLVSSTEQDEFPHLRQLLDSWTQSFEELKNRIFGLLYQADQIQKIEFLAEKAASARQLHDSLAETRSECLALLRSIFLMNSYFVDVDVKRVNGANAAYRKWKSHELCALTDPRMVKVAQPEDLQGIFALAENNLRQAMGLIDFNAGTTTSAGKRYEEWHVEVVAALESVSNMKQRALHKMHLLQMFRAAQEERKEIALLEIEDLSSSQIETIHRNRAKQADKYADFLAKCRESWQKGLEKRQNDIQEVLLRENAKKEELTRKVGFVEKMHKRDHHRRATMKLSIWEAVREGFPVEIIRTMIFAEMQKARRLGYDFVLRTARSDRGESLIQIACWWGHEHLVSFLLEEGANMHDADSYCNRFSLLHDAARRGHAQVVILNVGMNSLVHPTLNHLFLCHYL